MHHDIPLITTIVAGLVLAFIFGSVAHRLRLPPLVGYLFAGILVGPNTPGFVADQSLAGELAELGVILLMFGVGLHFSLKDLMSVRAIAIPGAIVQMGVATLLGMGLGLLLGWDLGGSLVFGIALSVASTVVLLKALQDRRIIDTEKGRIAVGWLIVEDLAMVLALVLVPAFASLAGNTEAGLYDPFVGFVERVFQTEVGIWGVLALTILKVAAFVGFMLIVGRRIIPWALHGVAHTGSRELFRLAVLAIALGVALGSSELFGVSLALGAFFAGMILSESELSHRAAQETLPLRDAFAVLFFVSVGMLFDPTIILTDPLPVIATVFIIVIGKSIAAFGIVILFGRSGSTALTISASLAQIGEFSFILASMGVALAIMPEAGQDLILAGALISIVLNPLVFFTLDRFRPQVEARFPSRRPGTRPVPRDGLEGPILPHTIDAGSDVMAEVAPIPTSEAEMSRPPIPEEDEGGVHKTTKSGHTILVGFGRVGSVIGEGLRQSDGPLLVIEDGDHAVDAARALGIEVVVGNASSPEVLELANIARARRLLIAIPNAFEAGQTVEQSRKLNGSIEIIARAHSDEEEAYLGHLGADTVIMGEREIGLGMLAWVRGEREMAAVSPRPPAKAGAGAAGLAVAGAEAAAPVRGEQIEPVVFADQPADRGGERPPEGPAGSIDAEAEAVVMGSPVGEVLPEPDEDAPATPDGPGEAPAERAAETGENPAVAAEAIPEVEADILDGEDEPVLPAELTTLEPDTLLVPDGDAMPEPPAEGSPDLDGSRRDVPPELEPPSDVEPTDDVPDVTPERKD